MKNNKYKLYVMIEILTFVWMVSMVIFNLMSFSESHMAETGRIGFGEVICPALELVIGIIILIVCIHMQAKSINEALYLENRILHAVVDSDFSLIFEYYIGTDEFQWYGDAEKIFNVSRKDTRLEQLSHPDDWPVILQQFEDAKRNIIYSVEARLRDAGGEYRRCNCRTIIGKEITGESPMILGIIQDAAVRQSDERCAG